jgi:hypothetical protein
MSEIAIDDLARICGGGAVDWRFVRQAAVLGATTGATGGAALGAAMGVGAFSLPGAAAGAAIGGLAGAASSAVAAWGFQKFDVGRP